MKTPAPKSAKPSRDTKRSFTWGVRSTEISFMRVSEAEAALDGCSNCCDCSFIAKIDKPRGKRPAPAALDGDGGSA